LFVAAMLSVTCGVTSAQAVDITFRILALPATGLEGWIYVRDPGKAWEKTYPVPSTGILKISRACAMGTFFQAHVSDDYMVLDRSNSEKCCAAGEITCLFREKTYAAVIRKALSGEALEGVSASEEITSLQAQLLAASKARDDESLLKSSSQIYNRLIASKNFV